MTDKIVIKCADPEDAEGIVDLYIEQRKTIARGTYDKLKLSNKEVRDLLVEDMRKKLGVRPRTDFWFIEKHGDNYVSII